ncbi:MAG: type II secretion system protein [Opitutae bacterium]|nr:type II secretion system protein [Opitutae bacterium]
MRRRFHSAFSLIEVVIAVGVFGAAIAVILALLPALTKQSSESAAALTAQQLGDVIRVELVRVASLETFDGLAGNLPVVAAPLTGGRQFVATRDGRRLHAVDPLPAAGAISSADQYFLIECWKFPNEPLRPDGTKAFLATLVRVSWPYQTGASGGAATTTPLESRAQLTFTCAINR